MTMVLYIFLNKIGAGGGEEGRVGAKLFIILPLYYSFSYPYRK